jgi:hypothetical protein
MVVRNFTKQRASAHKSSERRHSDEVSQDYLISLSLFALSVWNQCVRSRAAYGSLEVRDNAKQLMKKDKLFKIEAEFKAADRDNSVLIEYEVESAIPYWTRLKDEAGLDLRGVFRRRALVPFVFLPRHVASHHSQSKMLSVFVVALVLPGLELVVAPQLGRDEQSAFLRPELPPGI